MNSSLSAPSTRLSGTEVLMRLLILSQLAALINSLRFTHEFFNTPIFPGSMSSQGLSSVNTRRISKVKGLQKRLLYLSSR